MRRARDAARGELAAERLPRLLHRVGTGKAPQRPDEEPDRHQAEESEEQRRQLLPVGVAHAEREHQVPLPLGAVAQHPDVPLMSERFPLVARGAQPCHVRPQHERQAFHLRQRAREAVVHALRHRRRRRIDAHPAAAGEEHLGPCMGVRLAHGDDLVHGVEIAALVAGHHARRDAGRAHEHRKGGGEVLAEAGLGLEEELVHRVGAEERRLQRIGEASFAKEIECAREHVRVRAAGSAPFLGERHGAPAVPGRQAQRPREQRAAFLARLPGRDCRNHLVAQAAAHRDVGEHLPVEAHARGGGQADRRLEREEPRVVVRLQHHGVAIDAARVGRRLVAHRVYPLGRPGAPVEVP